MFGGVGARPGLGDGGFGDVGQAKVNFSKMVWGMGRLKEIISRQRRGRPAQHGELRQGARKRMCGDVQGCWSTVRTRNTGSSTWFRRRGAVEEADEVSTKLSWITKSS